MATTVKTDHSKDIEVLRTRTRHETDVSWIVRRTAADLLEMHDNQSLSLDQWTFARKLVELLINHPIEENHV